MPTTTTRPAASTAPSAPAAQCRRGPYGYCPPDRHTWTIQPGRIHQTCLWCDVIRP